MKKLLWLPVKTRIEFKILILTFKAYHEIGRKYLTDSLIKYTPSRTLPSTNKGLLVVPKYNLESYGKRAFSVIATSLWNRDLPDQTRMQRAFKFLLGMELRPFYLAVPFRFFLCFYDVVVYILVTF